VETADTSTTHESSQVDMTNENNDHNFLPFLITPEQNVFIWASSRSAKLLSLHNTYFKCSFINGDYSVVSDTLINLLLNLNTCQSTLAQNAYHHQQSSALLSNFPPIRKPFPGSFFSVNFTCRVSSEMKNSTVTLTFPFPQRLDGPEQCYC